jgi:hypothetical protein
MLTTLYAAYIGSTQLLSLLLKPFILHKEEVFAHSYISSQSSEFGHLHFTPAHENTYYSFTSACKIAFISYQMLFFMECVAISIACVIRATPV